MRGSAGSYHNVDTVIKRIGGFPCQSCVIFMDPVKTSGRMNKTWARGLRLRCLSLVACLAPFSLPATQRPHLSSDSSNRFPGVPANSRFSISECYLSLLRKLCFSSSLGGSSSAGIHSLVSPRSVSASILLLLSSCSLQSVQSSSCSASLLRTAHSAYPIPTWKSTWFVRPTGILSPLLSNPIVWVLIHSVSFACQPWLPLVTLLSPWHHGLISSVRARRCAYTLVLKAGLTVQQVLRPPGSSVNPTHIHLLAGQGIPRATFLGLSTFTRCRKLKHSDDSDWIALQLTVT